MNADAPVVIVGGGPAGMVAGLLFARAGVPVTILEKHADFLRDFRGDTVHPSTLELFNEIGLLEELLKEPHAAIDTMTLNLLGGQYTIATMKHLPVAARFVAMMPQWDLLDFIAGQGKRYPTFDLRMSTEATGLTSDAAGRVSGVTLASGETLPARLVIAADGPGSVAWTALGRGYPRGVHLGVSATVLLALYTLNPYGPNTLNYFAKSPKPSAPTADNWPRENFLIRVHLGRLNASTSSLANSSFQFG